MKTKQIKQEVKETWHEMIPMGKYLLVQRDAPEEKSSGGIIIPTNQNKKMNEGTVLAISDKCEQKWEVGDRIVFNEFGSSDVDIGDRVVLVTEDLVFVKFKK